MTRMVAAATQASISAACFIAGALLIAIGRGIANGMGGVGIDMDAPIFELPNGTSSSASSAQSFFERMMSDTAVHARWAHRRGAQAFDVFGLFFSVIGWVLAIPPISSLGAALGGQQRSCTNLVLYAFVAGGVLTLVEFTSEAGTAMVSDWMSQWPILATPTMNQAGELTAAQSFEITYMLVTSRSVWLYAMDSLFLAVALVTASYLTYTAPHQQVSKCHAHLGILIALLCLAEFGFEVTRFINWRASVNASIVCLLAIDGVMLPIWLLWLAATLRKINFEGGVYSNSIDPTKGFGSSSSSRDPAEIEAASRPTYT